MANEISFSAAISFFKAAVMNETVGKTITAAQFTVAGSYFNQGQVLVLTTATVIPLGQVTAPHWAFFKNMDPTNFIKIRNGASGADLLKLKPGEPAFCPLLDSAVPYAIADTASAILEFMIISL